MNRIHQTVCAVIVLLAISVPSVKAQSQQDLDNLQGLLPWAEALDKRIEEKRQREAQKVTDEIAQMEQSIKDTEARQAAKKVEMQQRAAAIKQWNPKDNLPPTLRTGEHIVLTRNGCRLVIAGDPNAMLEVPGAWDAQGKQAPAKRMSHKDHFASMLWSGDCELGVANGFGALAEPESLAQVLEYESAYSLGRALGATKTPTILSGDNQFEITIFKPGQKPITQQLREEAYKPLWGNFFEDGAPSTSLTYDGVIASTTKDGCLGIQGLTKKKFSGCSYKNNYPVYGVSVRAQGVLAYNSTSYCPNPKTPKGCEALWYQLAGPTIEKHKAAWLIAENGVKQETLAIQQFSATWLAQRQKYKESQERVELTRLESRWQANPTTLSTIDIHRLWNHHSLQKNDTALARLYEQERRRQQRVVSEAEARLMHEEDSIKTRKLSQQAIDACTREIHAKQIESQSWGGGSDAVAARLGQFQKEMFEGRCSAHPEAQAYINGANRMLGYQAAADSNGMSSVSGTAGKRKRSNVPEAHASHCLAPQKEGGVINNCAFAIEYSYCVVQPKPGSWSASFDCNQNKSGSWQVGANSRAIMHTNGAQVAFFGCRYGPTLSKPDGISPADFRYNPNGLPTGRCREWGAP